MAKDLKLDFPDGGTVLLSREDWNRFMRAIENPSPASEKLKELMRSEPDYPLTASKRETQQNRAFLRAKRFVLALFLREQISSRYAPYPRRKASILSRLRPVQAEGTGQEGPGSDQGRTVRRGGSGRGRVAAVWRPMAARRGSRDSCLARVGPSRRATQALTGHGLLGLTHAALIPHGFDNDRLLRWRDVWIAQRLNACRASFIGRHRCGGLLGRRRCVAGARCQSNSNKDRNSYSHGFPPALRGAAYHGCARG